MKKKNYRLLSLLFVLPLLLTGCGGKGGEGQGGGGGGSQPSGPAVTGVTIAEPDDTVVLDGTRATLKASVAGEEGVSQKVKWSSSDSTVATVTNGVVNFLKVAEQKKVIITATSDADSQFKDDVEFTVEHSPFDLKNSRGNPDTSCYLEDGEFIVEDPQDVALVYADVHDTRWYVEATITIDSHLMSDQWPKFGIMASDRDDGMWCYEGSHQFFYFADTPSAGSTWSALNVATETEDLTNWNWGKLIGGATATPAIKKGEPFKLGLMRDGNVYYQFYGKASAITLDVVGTFEYNSFGENPNYVWVGGWSTAVTVADPKCFVGDAIDALYTVPSGITLGKTEETLYFGASTQIEVSAEGLWNRQKLTFVSDDETIATVDAKGVVTANSTKTGTAHITVGLQGTELSQTFTLNVTDDPLFNVVLDGEMNDAIWTNKVKANKHVLAKANGDNLKIYAAYNSRGVYMFYDYNVKQLAACNDGWWTYENVEFRLADDDKVWSAQYWVSSVDGGSFVSVGSDAAGYTQKAEAVYYKPVTLGEDEMYHGAFEIFIPFGDDQVTKGQAMYACFGWAPRSGWQQGYNWYYGINEDTLKITPDGFAHDGTQCSETDGHAFDGWVVDLAPTCSAVGSRHRTCKVCNHTETEELPIDENAHNFDYEHAVVTTASTCISHGVGTATCTICGATDNTELPLDHTNHAGTYEDGMYTCCHVNVQDNQSLTLDNLNDGGWANHETNVATAVEGSNWTYEYEFDMTTNGISGNWWRGVLPIFKAADGDIAVARFDWWGWVDDRNGDGQSSISGSLGNAADNQSIYRNTEWYTQKDGGTSADFETVMTDCHVRAVIVRDGTNLNSTFYLRSSAIDFEYQYHFNLSGVSTSAVSFGVTAEFGKAVVTSCYRVA